MAQARYYVKAMRRSPTNPMSSVSYYDVIDSHGLVGGQRFSTHGRGWEVALHLANTMRDDMNAGRCDCQNPTTAGVAHISEACPVHNDRPEPDCRA